MANKKLQKRAGAFQTISEVATHLNVEQHVLRFWETKFKQIKPMKRGGGRRYYRPEDVAVLERIHGLLYNEGYTIKGAQNVLKGSTRNKIAAASNTNEQTSLSKQNIQAGLNDQQLALLSSTLSALKNMREVLGEAA